MHTYKAGNMGIAEGVAVMFFLLMPRLFLTTVAGIIGELGQITWLFIVINAVYPLFAAFMLIAVFRNTEEDFYTICQKLVGKPGALLISFYYILVFLANGILLIRQYSENTLTTALPEVDIEVVILAYIITIIILCWFGLEAMARTGILIMPFVVIGLLLIVGLLFPFYAFHHLSPWRGAGLDMAISSGISGAGYNLGFIAPFIFSPVLQKATTIKKVVMISVGLSIVLKIVFYLVYVMVFGTAIGAEKTMPFYELARLVYINPYIQRIEALFIVEWIWYGIVAIALSLYSVVYLLGEVLRLPDIRPLIVPVALLVGQLSLLPADIGEVIVYDNNLISLSNIGVYIIPTLLYIKFRLKKQGRKPQCSVGK